MARVRVYELARDLNVDSKTMMTRLKSMGIEVASHQSTLTDEQVVLIRKAITSGAPAKAEAKSTTVVIRRRRRPGEEEEAQEAAPPATEAPAAVANELATPSQVAQVAMEDTEEQPAQQQVAAAAAPAVIAERASTEMAAQERVVAEPPSAPGERVADRAAAVSRDRPRPGVGVEASATIVRRASPEEIARRQAQREGPPPGPRAGARREDSRGTRVSVGQSSDERVTAFHSATHEEANRTWVRKGKDVKEAPVVETPEEEALRKAVQKQKRAKHLSTRALLSQLDGEDDDLPEADAEVEAPVAQVKTVYTPNAQMRKRDLRRRKDLKKTQVTTPRAAYRVVKMGAEVTVAELAKQLAVKATDVIKRLMEMGVMASINSNIDFDTASLIAGEYKFEVKSMVRSFEDILGAAHAEFEEKAEKNTRPPIVTVMGHVDHGKTSILDAIRNANVTEGEAGGITQHIGAYTTVFNDKVITFIDTPGHEAFTSMRARGANITDIVVLVVAADDGVMPQTIEAISHARAAGVPIIVAVNKIDKHNINLDRVFTELTEHGIQSEEWGGDTQFVKVSALKRIGIEDLLDAILLQAEVLDLRATPDGPARGVVIEAHLNKGRGPVATVLIQSGTMRRGQDVVAGTMSGRVRDMRDHHGRSVETAGPSIPVEIIGLDAVPMAGDQVNAVEDEKKAREVVAWRQQQGASRLGKSSAQSLEDLLAKVKNEDHIEVPVIVKGDTQGSVEAVAEAIKKLNTEKVSNKLIHTAVGGITESDVSLAATSGAVVIGFNVRAATSVADHAEHQGVVIKYFSIIYEVVDAIKSIMTGSLPPIVQEVVIGHAEVRNPINIPKIGLIAGSAVTDGKITRQAHLRLIRDQVVIFKGRLGSLKRFKDDVSEVQRGYECGIGIEGCSDIREGDVIEAFVLEEHAATL